MGKGNTHYFNIHFQQLCAITTINGNFQSLCQSLPEGKGLYENMAPFSALWATHGPVHGPVWAWLPSRVPYQEHLLAFFRWMSAVAMTPKG